MESRVARLERSRGRIRKKCDVSVVCVYVYHELYQCIVTHVSNRGL